MTSCTIAFHNNPDGVYFAGQTLSGTATLTTAEPLSLRGAYIEVRGFGEVKMGRPHEHESYLNYKIYAFGKEHGPEIQHPAGTGSYNFNIQLPAHLPPSFVGHYGRIHYEVAFVLDRAWKANEYFSQPFTIKEDLDLNTGPIYRAPVNRAIEVTPFRSSFRGSIKVSCHIPLSGYTTQQKVPFHVVVKNDSVIDCVQTKVKLMQSVSYMRGINEQKIESMMVETVLGPVPRQSEKEFDDHLQLEPTTPITRRSGGIISIEYGIVVELQMPRFDSNIKLSLPIAIGTHPVREGNPVSGQGPVMHLYPGCAIIGGVR